MAGKVLAYFLVWTVLDGFHFVSLQSDLSLSYMLSHFTISWCAIFPKSRSRSAASGDDYSCTLCISELLEPLDTETSLELADTKSITVNRNRPKEGVPKSIRDLDCTSKVTITYIQWDDKSNLSKQVINPGHGIGTEKEEMWGDKNH